ncbi:probable G-protein coupled receptor 82 [Trichomycterus rosablanca]|uniref:probable G-protein coupled receptor 82 n=1 Tax=Trichomycterus rosablanca TaxID=2290929 RepID=UPI002F35DEEF
MAVYSQLSLSNRSSCLCQTSTTYLALPVLYIAMFLTGLSGNILSLWVFLAKISTKTSTHIYIINLGISNLILCLTMPFTAAYYVLGTSWPTPSLLCQLAINVLTPVLHANIGGGMLILTWLAISRFATLTQHNYGNRPSRCTKVLPYVFFSRMPQPKFALAMCLGTWAFVAMAIIPTVVIYSTMETGKTENTSEQICYNVAVEAGDSGSQAFAKVGISLFFVCLLLVLSAYLAVIRHFHRNQISTATSDRRKVYSRVVRNIVVIQIVMVVCLLPHHIFKAIFINLALHYSKYGEHLSECHPLSKYVEIKNVLLCLAVLRCSTDPFIYLLLDRKFKMHVCALFRGSSNTKESHSSRTFECGQLNQYDSGTVKQAVNQDEQSHLN